MSARKPIVVVGSINTDLVAVTKRIPVVGETVIGSDFQIHPGGKGANQAVAIARLGYPVCLIGCLGDDAFGAGLRSSLSDAGVDVSSVSTIDGASGVAVIVVSERGENTIVLSPGANARVTPAAIDANLSVLRGASMVLTQLEIPLETVVHLAEVCAREGVPLVLDPAPAMELPPALLKNVAWFTPNQTEAAFYLSGEMSHATRHSPAEMADTFLAKGCQGVVLKMGSQGAYVAGEVGVGAFVPAFPVHAIDSTAAGDAFNAGFATGLMLGKSPLDSAAFAAAVAGISVTRAGAQPSMPTMREVEAFMKNEPVHAMRESAPQASALDR